VDRKAVKPEPIVVSGEIVGGALKWSTAWKFVKAALKGWPDGWVDITIAVREDTRRAKANAFYWVFLTQWSRLNGHTKDELHEICKMRHNSKVIETVDPKTGEAVEMRIAQSTAKLTIADFSEFLERVMVDAAEMDGLVLEPRAHEDWREAA
jgi:hypothetical protein